MPSALSLIERGSDSQGLNFINVVPTFKAETYNRDTMDVEE